MGLTTFATVKKKESRIVASFDFFFLSLKETDSVTISREMFDIWLIAKPEGVI